MTPVCQKKKFYRDRLNWTQEANKYKEFKYQSRKIVSQEYKKTNSSFRTLKYLARSLERGFPFLLFEKGDFFSLYSRPSIIYINNRKKKIQVESWIQLSNARISKQ